jgi:chromate transporter
VSGILYGIKPVVIAVVAQALWRLGVTAIKSAALAAIAVLAAVGVTAGAHELLILLIAGGAMAALNIRPAWSPRAVVLTGGTGVTGLGVSAVPPAMSAPFGLLHLFFVFAKAGAVLFGSGYVLLAFLRADLVERLGWLTEQQLLDAIAIGQVTPGPVFTTATFIGFILGGATGAFVATVGIFLPAFIFVAISGPLVPRLRRSATAGRALDGINAASLGLMAAVTWQLGRAALVDRTTIALAGLSLLTLTVFRINSAWLIAAGAMIGWLLR